MPCFCHVLAPSLVGFFTCLNVPTYLYVNLNQLDLDKKYYVRANVLHCSLEVDTKLSKCISVLAYLHYTDLCDQMLYRKSSCTYTGILHRALNGHFSSEQLAVTYCAWTKLNSRVRTS